MTLRLGQQIRATIAIVSLIVAVACVGGGSTRRPVATPGPVPATVPAAGPRSVQGLYESGRYQDVLNSVAAGDENARALWFAAQSSLRLGQRDEAARQFARLAEIGGSPASQVVSDLALALLRNDPEEIDRAREAAAVFPSDPFVQYELGLAHARRNDMAAAAQAFDRATQADPRFAYAYYGSGLVWDKLDRADLTIARLEMFERLAPDAPERPEVASILQTVRGR
jgi:tetratricopeptide (TPR) repeat protein